MLNYVWLALLFLGIGAGLSTDIFNISKNKYQNGKEIPAYISFATPIDTSAEKTFDVNIIITEKEFNNFYKEKPKQDIILSSKISYDSENKSFSLFAKIPSDAPKILKEMAEVSGKADDITGTVRFVSKDSLGTNIKLLFEEISFVRLKDITNSALEYAGIAVNIALGLVGIMALWLGVMKIAEEAGLISIIARALKPITKFLFPDVPSDHPAMGSMIMNISANMLGLGNAATPFGLKAMEELDKLNPEKGTATNAMCTFLAINTAGITLIPATAIAIRASAGSSEPAVIIGTALFASCTATLVGITSAKILEKFPIKKGEMGNWFSQNFKGFSILFGILAAIALIFFTGIGSAVSSTLSFLSPEFFKSVIQVVSIIAIPMLIFSFVGYGAIKKVKIYEVFIEGAKEGFNVAIRIIPYLVAMLMAIGIFRSGGAMDWLVFVLRPLTDFIGMPAEALPMAIMRPLSGSGSLGIMAEIIAVHGPDSFLGNLVSTFYGSTETTFYVLAVYFGAVNIKRTRHALAAGLLADVAGILAAVFIVTLLFG